ncbi:hypothetical protein [Nocardioides sp. LML1-1-1.1]|uniref:hypothetical protein n=1 Tax=Nocardioides sp. LML1-1-1.1 TaxID=3135248 RepID=UPI00343C434D
MSTPDLSNAFPTDQTSLVVVGRYTPNEPVRELGPVTPPLSALQWVEFYEGKRAMYRDQQPMKPGYIDVRIALRTSTWDAPPAPSRSGDE